MRQAAIIAWLTLCSWQAAAYVPVWRSELALWAHAERQAPRKPRPALNLGKALALAGRVDDAQAFYRRAYQLAGSPHVPSYERDEARSRAEWNLSTAIVLHHMLMQTR